MTPDNEPTPRPHKAKVTSSPDKRIALILIDDNPLLREGLAAVLRAQPEFNVLAALHDAQAAFERARDAEPDVVVIDVDLEADDPLALLTAMLKETPHARVVVKGGQLSDCEVMQYLRAGASGFIMKDDSIEQLSKTIRCVAAGCQVLPPRVISLLGEHISRHEVTLPTTATIEAMHLTPREQQVIRLLSEGLSNKAIASRLKIAVHTVKSHVHNVLEKLALHTRLEVAAFAHSYLPTEEED